MTWSTPVDWAAAPTASVTPGPAVGVVPLGTVRAGHTAAHVVLLSQALIPLWSWGKVYRANPLASVSTAPKVGTVATFTVAVLADAALVHDASTTTTDANTAKTPAHPRAFLCTIASDRRELGDGGATARAFVMAGAVLS